MAKGDEHVIITKDGNVEKVIEIDRQSHLAGDVAGIILSAGLGALGRPTPDTIIGATEDGRKVSGTSVKDLKR